MTAFRRTAFAALALSVVASASAGAQGAKKCDINTGSPFGVNGAKIYLNKAMGTAGAADEKPRHLKSAIAALEKVSANDNALGREWVLGKTLLWWTMLPGQTQTVVKRGDVGFTTNPGDNIDLLMAADSAFSYVEANAPQCADSVDLFRRQAWVRLINGAITAGNNNQLDSSEALAKRSLVIYRKSPYAYNQLGLIAQKRNDDLAAAKYFQQTVDAAQGDTSAQIVKLKRSAMRAVAVYQQNAAEVATGDQKAALSKQAAESFKAYLKEVPDDAEAQAALARAMSQSGDTAAVAAIYADMMANPSKYTDQQLVQAGVGAFNSGRKDDAVKLFRFAATQNPYSRDANFDLASSYVGLTNPDSAEFYARRAIAVDPNNPDNWSLLADAYQLRLASKDAKVKKMATDSLLILRKRVMSMPQKVSFTAFDHAGAKHTLSGVVQNLGTAPGNYALKFEFLDKNGNVVASQTANVGPVAPKESKPFSVTVEQTGIVAFRYAPLQ
jgi:tetratricopeptide (TPR) repeat protein